MGKDKHPSEDERISALEMFVENLQADAAHAPPVDTEDSLPHGAGFPLVVHNHNLSGFLRNQTEKDATDDHVRWRTDRAGKRKIVGPLSRAHIYRIHNTGRPARPGVPGTRNRIKIYVDGVYVPPPLAQGETRDVEASESIELETDLSDGGDNGWGAEGWYQGPLS